MGGTDDTKCPVKDVDGDKSKSVDDGEPRLSGPLRPGTGIPPLRGGDCDRDGVVNASSFSRNA